MSETLVDLTELAGLAAVPVAQLRRYAEVGLLPPARRDGDRLGYPPAEAHPIRMIADVERLGLSGDDLTALASAWRGGDCGQAQRHLAEAVTSRLVTVENTLAEQQQRATEQGPGSPGWVEAHRLSVPLAEDAARLQAVSAALGHAAPPGPCGEGCGCAVALAAPGTTYHFPAGEVTSAPGLACDLAADGGDAAGRISVWQQVLTRVGRRDPLPDTANGLALCFPLEADLAATLARLAAAEYRCCSFGSYTIVIDHTGLRLEVRMPGDAAGMLAAVLGVPDAAASDREEVSRAPDQP
jgi:DNA-binding transcriptional MerR regulator